MKKFEKGEKVYHGYNGSNSKYYWILRSNKKYSRIRSAHNCLVYDKVPNKSLISEKEIDINKYNL